MKTKKTGTTVKKQDSFHREFIFFASDSTEFQVRTLQRVQKELLEAVKVLGHHLCKQNGSGKTLQISNLALHYFPFLIIYEGRCFQEKQQENTICSTSRALESHCFHSDSRFRCKSFYGQRKEKKTLKKSKFLLWQDRSSTCLKI